MFPSWLSSRLKKARSRWKFCPLLEALEDRAVPSTATWDGGGGTNNWSDRFNWVRDGVRDVAPLDGDDLVFPLNAAQLSNFNNFASGTSFHSLTFTGANYTISGGSFNVLNLGTGGITNNFAKGINRYNGPIQLNGTRMINVADGGQLNLGGVLSGSGGITVTGDGTLEMNGADANTYSGTTTVQNGITLLLKKGSSSSPAVAIPGNLVIAGNTGSPLVRVLRTEQIKDSALVTLTATGGSPLLIVDEVTETIKGLNLTGGRTTSTTNGLLVLSGDITAQPSLADLPEHARMDGNISLRSASRTTITVNGATGFPDVPGLRIDAFIDGTNVAANVVKEGSGAIDIYTDTGSSFLNWTVNAGSLFTDGSHQRVTLKNRATLGGRSANNAIMSDGFAQAVDDGSFGFTAPGWTTITGSGFGNDVTLSGSTTTGPAEWAFNFLPFGFYRVFATWTGGTAHTNSASFSIFDGTIPRGVTSVNEELLPAGGPHSGGRVFQQLGERVFIQNGTLRVSLSNFASPEKDGAKVVADSIRIERLSGTVSPGGLDVHGNLDPDDVEFMDVVNSLTLGPGSTYRVDFENNGPGSNAADKLHVDGIVGTSETMLVLSASTFSPPNPGTAYRIFETLDPCSFENAPNTNDTIVLTDGTGQRHTFTINYDTGTFRDVDLIYQNTFTQVRDLKLSPDVIKAGNRVNLHGALTDPNPGDVLSLRIDWGDDSAVENFTDLGTKAFQFSHIYAAANPSGSPYEVHVEWFDQKGGGNFLDLFVTVNESPSPLFDAAVITPGRQVVQPSANFASSRLDSSSATVASEVGSGVQPVQPKQKWPLEHRDPKPGKDSLAGEDNDLSTDTFEDIVRPAL